MNAPLRLRDLLRTTHCDVPNCSLCTFNDYAFLLFLVGVTVGAFFVGYAFMEAQ